MASELLTTTEAAKYIRKSPCWLLANRKKAKIPSFKIGGEYRYRPQELDQWLDAQRANDFEVHTSRTGKKLGKLKVQLI
jgi:hypothetical protein